MRKGESVSGRKLVFHISLWGIINIVSKREKNVLKKEHFFKKKALCNFV